MKKFVGLLITISLIVLSACSYNQRDKKPSFEAKLFSPDSTAIVTISEIDGSPYYSLSYKGEKFIEDSPIGIVTDLGDFSKDLKIKDVTEVKSVSGKYRMRNAKKSDISYNGSEYTVVFGNDTTDLFSMEWHLQNNDVAFRYTIIPHGETRVCRVLEETTEFTFPEETTTFLSEQMEAMGGWMRTAPSYETSYLADAMMDRGYQAKDGFVFPSLFKIGDNGWLQLSETGVGGNYSASHLKYKGQKKYQYVFPDENEFNGNGTSQPGLSLPGVTPWRTITFGSDLSPIAETTIQFDLVEPLYEPSKEYEYGKGTWSWIIYDDWATIYPIQEDYVNFSKELGYKTVLVDGKWDTQIGRDSIEILAAEASKKDVGIFLWYNSNGYWNDSPQTPRDVMNNSIKRKKEMKWMQENGIKGIKVDFMGSDKQQAMQLYEDILADANDHGLMVIFHGATLPRGWEKMYPNFISNEAVRASENLRFLQEECDNEAYNATFHPVSRNAVASMDFGGSTLNKYYNPENKPGASERKTSDVFALATAVMFQSPVQHFALARSGIEAAPEWAVEFMKEVPTTWDDIRWIEGYPGKNVAMARKNGDKWYVVGINALEEPFSFSIPEELLDHSSDITVYSDDNNLTGKKMTVTKENIEPIIVPKNGAYLAVITVTED